MELHNIEELLVQQNPHWLSVSTETKGFVRESFNFLLKEVNKHKLILTLYGPRRSGKTYLMKQVINHLIGHDGVDARNVCYFQFSGSLNEKGIVANVIDLFLKKYSKVGRKYIFLDKVQYVDYWQDQVKEVYDTVEDIKVILSGSTSLFYRQKSKESLAGRIFKFKLGSLSFAEYLTFKGISVPSTDRPKFISNLSIYKTEFRKFLSTGQYPEIVANPEIDPKKYVIDLADQIINFDIPYIWSKVDRQLFLGVVKTLSHDLADEFSANNLAKVLGADRREIAEYIKILEEVNLFKVCYNSSFKSMRKKLSGSKKIYSQNLNLSLFINGFDSSYLNDSRVFGKYLKNYVFQRIQSRFDRVGYFRENGKELDFVTEDEVFEIKSNNNLNPLKYQEIASRLGKKFNLITEEDAYLL